MPVITFNALFPTHVGMNRNRLPISGVSLSVPHARGDEPVQVRPNERDALPVPHARGDEPRPCSSGDSSSAVPHARGDEPTDMHPLPLHQAVPHARGDEPQSSELSHGESALFPTHVGMNRTDSSSVIETGCSPRTWG